MTSGVAECPKIGRPPILDNTSFLSSIKEFGVDVDVGRATGKMDMNKILKGTKENVAKIFVNSATMVVTPTKRSMNNYIALLA